MSRIFYISKEYKDKILTPEFEERLFDAWTTSNDGAGFMYSCDNKLYIKSGYFLFEPFYNLLCKCAKRYDSNFVISFRTALVGNSSKANCQPNKVNNNLAVCSFGAFGMYLRKSILSDMRLFIKDILSKIGEDFIKNEGKTFLISELCKENDISLLFMNNFGTVFSVNVKSWETIDGILEIGGSKITKKFDWDDDEYGVYRKENNKIVKTIICNICYKFTPVDEVKTLYGLNICQRCINKAYKQHVFCSQCKDFEFVKNGVCSQCGNKIPFETVMADTIFNLKIYTNSEKLV